MKKALKTSLSLLLSLLMMFSIVTPAFAEGALVLTGGSSSSSSTTNMPAYQMNMTFSTIDVTNVNFASPTTSMFQNLCTGSISMVATRAVQGITSLLIKKDIPGLSKALVMMQDPATRAELQHKQLVQEMAKSIEEIKQSVARIENQLKDISNKIDEYATAEALRDATTALNGIVSKYQVVWGNYQAVIAAGGTLSQLEDQYAEEASETEESTNTDEQSNPQVAAAKEALTTATNIFINSIEEGGGLSFLNDLQKIPGYLWNPADATSDYDTSYLGAYEAYLRERYPFEHQITSELYTAVDTCINIQLQMLLLYSEYYTYKKEANPTAYSSYTDEYFSKIQYGIIQNMAAMVESTGFGTYMRAEALKEDELTEIKKYDPNLIEPENINSSITINGTEYSAYKIRDNSSLSYYKIITEEIDSKSFVKKIYSDSTNNLDLGKYIYRPSFMLNSQYSDDGIYRMISDISEIPFASSWTDILASLRDYNGCNLSDIPQSLTHLLLYSDNFVSNKLEDSYWQISSILASDSDNSVVVDTDDIYNGDSTFVPLIIYKDISTLSSYSSDGTLILNDKGLVNNQTFVVSDGQTLDISLIELDLDNVTIIISGTGTVISNPDITLKNSSVIITGTEYGDAVFLKNLNVTARNYEEAALTVNTSCNVGIEGTCSFNGTSSEASIEDVYRYYSFERPTFASHGILVNGSNSIVSFVGTKDGIISYNEKQQLIANGAGGGAGICQNCMNLTLRYIDVTAKGSQASLDFELPQSGEQLYTIGAGIGASVSCIITSNGSFNVKTSECIVSKGASTINGTNYLSIENSTVKATGIKSSRRSDSYLGDKIYSEDIGGVNMPENDLYYCVRTGSFTNSTISATNLRISSRFSVKNLNNLFIPDIYTITAYTKGSNGVTTDGVYFKFNGDNGSTGWILASEIGNDKGSCTQTVKGVSVGNITSVEVKTNSSNHWWPGKIDIVSEYNGSSITVYGGRWIGNSGTVLSPDDNIYKVTVNTGTAANSGTDAAIYLQLQDADSTVTSNVHLSDIHQDSNAFEKGDTDVFWIYAPDDFGECTHAKFYSDNSNASSGWLLDSFTIEKVQGSDKDNDKFTVYSGQWFEEERTIDFGKYSGETGAFYIEVKTSDVSKAGTDSNIYLTIYGDKGNTGKINLGTYAQGDNNFEKNDKDCFYIGYDVNGIGTINKIEITKDNKGVGPDWHLEYIKITEVVSSDKDSQSVRFDINQWIENKTYTFNKSSNTMVTGSFIDRDILKGLTKNEDGSYTLVVNRNINMTHEVFDLLIDAGIILTVEMMNDDGEMIYSLTFDGNQITNHHNIELKQGYSASDGNAVIDFLAGAALPAGTTVAINTELLGFTDSDSLVLLTKNEDGEWNETLKLVNADGIVEFSIEEGKALLINNGAPLPEDGETEPDAESEADSELNNICDFFSRLSSFIIKLFNFIINLSVFLLRSCFNQ